MKINEEKKYQSESDSIVQSWSKYAKVYDPIKCASIDGTDIEPHDRAVVRAINSTYRPNRFVKGRPECTIFVSRLNHDTSKDTIKEIFSKYGKLKRFRMVKDIVTGMPKGYAFVEFEEERAAEDAYRLANKMVVDGHFIFVDFECERLLKGWKPRRLGGGFAGKKESGQLRFGGRDRPFKKPIALELKEKEEKKLREKKRRREEEQRHRREKSRERYMKRKSPNKTVRNSPIKERIRPSPPRQKERDESPPRKVVRPNTPSRDLDRQHPQGREKNISHPPGKQSPSRNRGKSRSPSHSQSSRHASSTGENGKCSPKNKECYGSQILENDKHSASTKGGRHEEIRGRWHRSPVEYHSHDGSRQENSKLSHPFSTREKDIKHHGVLKNDKSSPGRNNSQRSPEREKYMRHYEVLKKDKTSPGRNNRQQSPEREKDMRHQEVLKNDKLSPGRNNRPRSPDREKDLRQHGVLKNDKSSPRRNNRQRSPEREKDIRHHEILKNDKLSPGRNDRQRSPVHRNNQIQSSKHRNERFPQREPEDFRPSVRDSGRNSPRRNERLHSPSRVNFAHRPSSREITRYHSPIRPTPPQIENNRDLSTRNNHPRHFSPPKEYPHFSSSNEVTQHQPHYSDSGNANYYPLTRSNIEPSSPGRGHGPYPQFSNDFVDYQTSDYTSYFPSPQENERQYFPPRENIHHYSSNRENERYDFPPRENTNHLPTRHEGGQFSQMQNNNMHWQSRPQEQGRRFSHQRGRYRGGFRKY